jgi:microcin C transport system substrate-binding protein
MKGIALFLLLTLHAMTEARVPVKYAHNGVPDIAWQANEGLPLTEIDEVIPGGIYRQGVASLPTNLRRIGPDTNNEVAALLNQMQMPLLAFHPDNNELISMLCSDWNIEIQMQTLYCKIDKDARWSDGVAVTTADIAFTFEFIQSDNAQAPIQNETVSNYLESVEIFSEKIFSLKARLPLSNQVLNRMVALRPLAKHFYTSRDGWPNTFDRLSEPSTSAYYIDKISSSGRVTIRKTLDWWAAERPFFAGRFNVDRVIYQRYKDATTLLDDFQSGEIDSIPLQKDSNWQSARIKQLNDRKRMAVIEFYHQGKTRFSGLILNKKHPELQAIKTRKTIVRAMSGESVDTKDLPAFELLFSTNNSKELKYYIDNAIRAGLRLIPRQIDHSALMTKLRNDDYPLAWIAIKGTPDNPFSGILNTAPSVEELQTGIDNFLFVPGASQPYSRYAYWQWLELPERIGTRISSDLFDPFDPVSGGVFWINPERRADILNRPDRRSGERPVRILDERFKFKEQ